MQFDSASSDADFKRLDFAPRREAAMGGVRQELAPAIGLPCHWHRGSTVDRFAPWQKPGARAFSGPAQF
jgi:hypothetical protein